MVRIVLTEDQSRAIKEADDIVEIVDSGGKRLGFVARPFTEEDIAIARKRAASDEPRRSTQHVLDRLNSLEQQ